MNAVQQSVRTQIATLAEFEPFTITAPSFVLNLMVAAQILVLGAFLDACARANPAFVTPPWSGFAVFAPAFAHGVLDFYRMAMINSRRTTELTALARPLQPGEQPVPAVPGVPNTPDEYAREVAQCSSLLIKRVAWWITLWGPILKISFDVEGEYTWLGVLWPMAAFFLYFAVIGWKLGNTYGTDERVLNMREANAVAAPASEDDLFSLDSDIPAPHAPRAPHAPLGSHASRATGQDDGAGVDGWI